jgi:hypothetical protein
MASLQARLDEFKKAFESGAPPYNAPREAIDTMHRATAKLKATGIEERRRCRSNRELCHREGRIRRVTKCDESDPSIFEPNARQG